MNLFSALFKARKETLPALAEALLSGRGEASGVALAKEFLQVYAGAGEHERASFLGLMAKGYGPDPKRLERSIAAYQSAPGADTAARLHSASEPRMHELLRRLNLAPGGTAALVGMRQDVMRCMRDEPQLMLVDTAFEHLFSSWFNRGFLVLKRIDWSTPAAILEKIIRYEAVHQINGWADLRRRLDPGDRRCFAFFHPALEDDPLIFVEVALLSGIPPSIAPLLAEEREPIDPERAKVAVFYSISNCQDGLKGISFGNFLIKQVVSDLKFELPHLKKFVTLSPVPGFAQWLRRERDKKTSEALSAEDKAVLMALDGVGWYRDPDALKCLKPVMFGAIAFYFLAAKRALGVPLDPVARFHLGNGARLERLNWMGDVSEKGLKESAGFMVNYLYDPGSIESNHELYASGGEVVASAQVRHYLPRRRAAPSRP